MKKIIVILVIIILSVLSYLNWIKTHTNDSTTLTVVNEAPYKVKVWLTLSGYPDSVASEYIQNVDSVFGISSNGLQGYFWLEPGDSVSYTSSKYFSGNLSFGMPPANCPDSSAGLPTGINIFEFNLNNPQESIDISCMAGVNCIMQVSLIGGPDWPADTAMNPRLLQNDSMWQNTGRVGVYPYGCTNCTNTEGKQPCQNPSETPNQYNICNPTRASGVHGGVVRLAFKGYTNLEPLE